MHDLLSTHTYVAIMHDLLSGCVEFVVKKLQRRILIAMAIPSRCTDTCTIHSIHIYCISLIKHLSVYFFHTASRCGVYLRAAFINLSTIMPIVN